MSRPINNNNKSHILRHKCYMNRKMRKSIRKRSRTRMMITTMRLVMRNNMSITTFNSIMTKYSLLCHLIMMMMATVILIMMSS